MPKILFIEHDGTRHDVDGELGSTVILLTEADGPLVPSIARDEHVLYGQPALTRSPVGTPL